MAITNHECVGKALELLTRLGHLSSAIKSPNDVGSLTLEWASGILTAVR